MTTRLRLRFALRLYHEPAATNTTARGRRRRTATDNVPCATLHTRQLRAVLRQADGLLRALLWVRARALARRVRCTCSTVAVSTHTTSRQRHLSQRREEAARRGARRASRHGMPVAARPRRKARQQEGKSGTSLTSLPRIVKHLRILHVLHLLVEPFLLLWRKLLAWGRCELRIEPRLLGRRRQHCFATLCSIDHHARDRSKEYSTNNLGRFHVTCACKNPRRSAAAVERVCSAHCAGSAWEGWCAVALGGSRRWRLSAIRGRRRRVTPRLWLTA